MTPVISDAVRSILTATVYDVAIESPLERADKLSAKLGHAVYLKREDLQPVHSFKLRGAYNKMSHLSAAERKRGVICASAGNHAQGVALAARTLGVNALIVMPRTTPLIKVDAVRSLGAEIELFGDNYSETAEHATALAASTRRTYVHPFDDPLVIAGQGTVGREIIEQLPSVTHIFVPVGGGGLIAGIAHYVKALRPDVKVIGVEPTDSAAMARSIAMQRRVTLPHVGIFADGVAVKQVGVHTFEAVRDLADGCITVTPDQICAAIKDTFEATRSIVEPAGALSLAGLASYNLPSDAHAVAICSGANISFERLQQIAERTLVGSGREALLAVKMPEKPGSLRRFCDEVVDTRSITEFSYRLSGRTNAHVLVGITVAGDDDRHQLCAHARSCGFECIDFSHNDLVKDHVRHLIGGRSLSADEQFYLVDFPERPGALRDFLDTIDSRDNISLFHYRSAASDTGSVLIGFETNNPTSLATRLKKTGFSHRLVSQSTAIELFC